MESIGYMIRSSEFPRVRPRLERQLVCYQFARAVDEWIWRLGRVEKKGASVSCGRGEKNAAHGGRQAGKKVAAGSVGWCGLPRPSMLMVPERVSSKVCGVNSSAQGRKEEEVEELLIEL